MGGSAWGDSRTAGCTASFTSHALLIPFVLADTSRVAGPGLAPAGCRWDGALPVPARRRAVVPPAGPPRLDFFDLATIISLWLPVEFGWLPDIGPWASRWRRCWPWWMGC